MKRRREQKGTVYAKSGMWFIRYSDFRVTDGQLERKRLAKQLGSVEEMTKKQARAEAKDFLAKINLPTLTPETAVTLVAFVESVYMPRAEQRMRPSTHRGYKVLWREIKPFCEGLWTRDVRTRHVQTILDAMAKTDRFNINSLNLKHIKSFLSGIFRLADQQGYYEGANPVRETSLPKVRPSDETHAYSLEEVLTMIDAVPEPASTLIAAAAFTGARRGELRGMFWENYQDGELLIARSIWNGITTDPKSRKSKAPIPIIPKLAAKLEAHRETLGKPKTGPIFPNGSGNAMDPDSLLRRAILPALEVCEVCSKPESDHGKATHTYERNTVLPTWRGWHAFRRGLATNLNRLGVDDSVIQRILRHSNVAVTQACYIKTASEDAKAAMQKLETALNDTYVTPRHSSSGTKGVM